MSKFIITETGLLLKESVSAVADGVITAVFGDTGKTLVGNCKKTWVFSELWHWFDVVTKNDDHDFRFGRTIFNAERMNRMSNFSLHSLNFDRFSRSSDELASNTYGWSRTKALSGIFSFVAKKNHLPSSHNHDRSFS